MTADEVGFAVVKAQADGLVLKIEADLRPFMESVVSKTIDRLAVEGWEPTTHSEETLMKVRRALGRTLDSQQVTDCISEMQNAGILFRERSDRD